jgi:hypothetical protein
MKQRMEELSKISLYERLHPEILQAEKDKKMKNRIKRYFANTFVGRKMGSKLDFLKWEMVGRMLETTAKS